MYNHTTGYSNEFEFVKLLNNKKVKELDPISKEMIYTIYNNISEEELIKCWRNHLPQKGDILINIRGIIKSISIKMGAKNSVHVEHIHYFIDFLKENNIPKHIIRYYLEYHYADGTLSGNGIKRLSVEEYKKDNQNKIDLIIKYFSKDNFVLNCIDRFILNGTNCDYSISGIICGIPNDYFFISSDKIKELLLKNKDGYSTGVHISNLFIQPKARDLKYTGLYENERHYIQVKWFSIFDDLLKEQIDNFQDHYTQL